MTNAKYNRRIGHVHFNQAPVGAGGVNACPSNALLYSRAVRLVTCPKCQATKAFKDAVLADLQAQAVKGPQ